MRMPIGAWRRLYSFLLISPTTRWTSSSRWPPATISAELRPDQTDQDSLPPYAVLDAIMSAYMEQNLSPAEIVAGGQREEDVQRVVGLIKRNEYKRRQAPVGIRITQRGFGKDWRYPITSRYREKFGG